MSTVPTTPLAPEELRRRVAEELESWEAGELAAFLERRGESKERFLTGARNEVDRVYGPEHVADTRWEDIGLPGRYPYTRGPYPTMYRARPWTMRQIAGFGTAEDTNQRFQYLIAQGQTGISRRLRHADADGLRLRRPEVASARSAARASRSTRSTTWRRSSTASTSRRSRSR